MMNAMYRPVRAADVARMCTSSPTSAARTGRSLAFIMVGAVSGYSGTTLRERRPDGDFRIAAARLLIGMLVVATGNPLLLLLVRHGDPVNGATGLMKVEITRFFGIRILGTSASRCTSLRKNLGLVNSQVLVRFMLMHLGLSHCW